MHEQPSSQNQQPESWDLEQRLRAYYGPPFTEQHLAPTAWYGVRHRLGVQASSRCRRSLRLRLPRRRSRAFVPAAMHDAFVRIASEAGLSAPKVVLRYRMKP